MKTHIYFCLAVLILASVGVKSQVLYSDDFESYTVGQGIALQSPEWWDTWSGSPGSAEDPLVSDNYALSGTKSIQVYGDNDGVIDFGGITEGRYRVEFYILIPSGRQGYYNIMQNFNPQGQNLIWGLQVFFQNGVCTIDGNGAAAASFNYVPGEWMKFQHFIDLNSDWIDMYVDDQLIHAYQWSMGTFGQGGINQLGAFDFYAWNVGGTCEYYMDDFLIEEVETPYPPTNLNTEIVNGNDVILTWEAPTEGDPQSYSVVRGGVQIAVVDSELTYTDENLYPQSYTYDLYAFYGPSSGYSSSAGPAVVNIPGGNEREFVLFEVFTGTWCQFCPRAAQAFQMMHSANLDVAVLAYHAGDPYETPNTGVIMDYYVPFYAEPGSTSFGFPATIMNGMEGFEGAMPSAQEQFEVYEYYYNQYINIPTVYTIDAHVQPHHSNPEIYELEVTVEETFPYFDDEIRLMVALTETAIPESWLGQTHVNNVVRSMYPNANGTVMDFAGQTVINQQFSLNVFEAYVHENCSVVVYLQNRNTAHVMAALKIPVIDLTDAKINKTTEIMMYPNPAAESVTITSDEKINNLEIYNTAGQTLINLAVDNFDTEICLSKYDKGVYFVKIYTDSNVSVKKLILK